MTSVGRSGCGDGSRGGGAVLMGIRHGTYIIIIILIYLRIVCYIVFSAMYYNIILFCLFWLSSLCEYVLTTM